MLAEENLSHTHMVWGGFHDSMEAEPTGRGRNPSMSFNRETHIKWDSAGCELLVSKSQADIHMKRTASQK